MNAIKRHPKIQAGIIPSKGPTKEPSLVEPSRFCAAELSGNVSGFGELCKRIVEQIIRFQRFLIQIKLYLRTVIL